MCFNSYVTHIQPSARKDPLSSTYFLHGHMLEMSDCKYLGVTITDNLFWTKSIGNAAARGNWKVDFLQRNFKKCTPKVKSATFTPQLWFAPYWNIFLSCQGSLYCKQKDTQLPEKVQHRAARYVSVDQLAMSHLCSRNQNGQAWKKKKEHSDQLRMLIKLTALETSLESTTFIPHSDLRLSLIHI